MALRNQPYIPLYVQDWLTDEKLRECSAASVGIYSFIICVMHKSEQYGIILLKQKDNQNENQVLNFAMKLSKHLPYPVQDIFDAVIELLDEEVLYMDGLCLCQKRMIKDNEISIKRSEAGYKGGKSTQFAKSNTQPKQQANTEDESANETETLIEDNTIKESFEKFWDLYDRKRDKDKTFKLWCKLNILERASIMVYVPKYKEAQPDKQFRRDPSTFINQKTWESEIIKPKDQSTWRDKLEN